MIKKVVFTILVCVSYISALTLSDVQSEEEKVHTLSKTVNSYYTKILSDTIGDIDKIFKYKDNKSLIIKEWFFVVSQKNRDSNMGYFANETKYIIDGYLQQLNAQDIISTQDYKIVRKRLQNIGSNTKEIEFENRECMLSNDVNFRNLPLVSAVTKKSNNKNSTILKKNTKVKLLYKIWYKNRYKHKARWAYIMLDNGDKGWINLKYCRTRR